MLSFSRFVHLENLKIKLQWVFSKLIVSLLDMYQQVIFSNSLVIVSARVFKFLHLDTTLVSSVKLGYTEKFVRLEEVIYIYNKQ